MKRGHHYPATLAQIKRTLRAFPREDLRSLKRVLCISRRSLSTAPLLRGTIVLAYSLDETGQHPGGPSSCEVRFRANNHGHRAVWPFDLAASYVLFHLLPHEVGHNVCWRSGHRHRAGDEDDCAEDYAERFACSFRV